MNRRRFLHGASGSILALSGCLSARNPAPTTLATTVPTSSASPPSEASPTTVAAHEERTRISDPNDAIAIESFNPVSGANVNVGVAGIAKNRTGRWLVDCILEITGVVGGRTFSARATRSPLAPHGTWTWRVPFGKRADALEDDSPDHITIDARAAFLDWS